MKVVITGGRGFLGTEVVRQLMELQHDVRIIASPRKRKMNLEGDYELVQVDLRSPKGVTAAFEGAELCINLAAQVGGIGFFHKYPATILNDNAKILATTFEAAVKCGVKRMAYISSSMVFERATRFPYREDELWNMPPPITPYGFSKLLGEKYCEAFHEEFGLDYTICRPFNTYGINEFPGQEVGRSHVIPDLIKKILSGQYPLKLLGGGQQRRCYTHIRDVAQGIIIAGTHPKGKNQDFNISVSRETSVLELAKLLWNLCGRKEPFKFESEKPFEYDSKRRFPDTSKMRELLGWEPKISLEEGLPEVVEWLKSLPPI